ncbi:hypothetical protein LLE49_23685 [Alicyclobacillus tolerans]|uniref:hypothetical protein n=1 Tax=Alicyclobacillus tolerans TaxID=90970 RepID=UPI001F3CF100|nr:hypothetical protein [Alicyclobacillus tolerans]MCF8567726.1 hypothetical protein [Alicyclobacillus tolerans]
MNEECIREIVQEELQRMKEEAADITAALEPTELCVVCRKNVGTLYLEADKSICEDCAQYMSEIGNELSL